MKLSKRGEYGLRAMIDLATTLKAQEGQPNGEVVQIKDIAERQKIPAKFLEQILQMCREADAEEDTGAPTSAAGATAGTPAGKMNGGKEASQ